MSQLAWTLLAKFLALKWPRLLLTAWAVRRPYFHLKRPNGEVYMHRWWARKEPDAHWTGIAARLHHIALPDDDRDLHDHPYDYRTIILKGWYIEETLNGTVLHKAGSTVAHPATHYHSIREVSPGGVWTLFIYRYKRPNNRWGFLVDGRKVPHGYYESIHGKGLT